MLVKLKKSTIEKCVEFAEKCVDSNKYYASRGQANRTKIVQDIITGKLGEFAAYELLSSKFDDVSLPDLEIYSGNKKSHGADLTAGNHKFSIKTQSLDSMKKYGVSWLMEKNSLDKFRDHMVILCVQLEPDLILIQNLIPFTDMLAVQGEPRLKHLTTKCAFYYNDIMLSNIKEL